MSNRLPRVRGFTLIELLVVIGILVIVMSLVIPMGMRARRNANVARVKMDLNSIGVALDAYKTDHGDYPRVDGYGDTGNAVGNNYRGAIILTRALIAPGPETDTEGVGSGDGAAGAGFRTRGTQGRKYGPYVSTDNFRLGSDPAGPVPGTVNYLRPLMFDHLDKAILYFPARAGRPDISQANMFVKAVATTTGPKPLYNAADNSALAEATLQQRLGDVDNNGALSPGEKAVFTGPFILWTAGIDGELGTEDDITNFGE